WNYRPTMEQMRDLEARSCLLDLLEPKRRTIALSNSPALVPNHENFCCSDGVKAPGSNDRNPVHIDLILTGLRSFDRGSFHAGPNNKNFHGWVLGPEELLQYLSLSFDQMQERQQRQFLHFLVQKTCPEPPSGTEMRILEFLYKCRQDLATPIIQHMLQ